MCIFNDLQDKGVREARRNYYGNLKAFLPAHENIKHCLMFRLVSGKHDLLCYQTTLARTVSEKLSYGS